MKYKYDIVVEPVLGGRKKVTISFNGKVIGHRTSIRIYRFALAVTGNYAYDLRIAKKWLGSWCREADLYQAILDDVPGACDRFTQFEINGCLSTQEQVKFKQNFLKSGNIVSCLNKVKDRIEGLVAKLKILESGPQSEHTQPRIVSWHVSRKNVPKPQDHYTFFDIVDIPVIAQIDAIDSQIDTSI